MATQQKRPRLSLKIQTSLSPVSRVSRDAVNPKDATALNTLSNAYASAIEKPAQTPAHAEPLTAINTLQAFSIATPVERQDLANRVNTPYVTHYPDTPLSAHPMSPRPVEVKFPSNMTATPPLSGTTDSNESRVFTFAPTDTAHRALSQKVHDPSESSNTKPRTIVYQPVVHGLQPPYTPSAAKHSILRNSPLPIKTAIPPPSPRRQSLRLQQKAARRVGYNSPLEQEITTNKYTKSHIDLLAEDSPLSPFSPTTPTTPSTIMSGLSLASPATETPVEARKSGSSGLATPIGIRKRKGRKEKTRRWVWTIGRDEDEEEQAVESTNLTHTVEGHPKAHAMEDMTPIGPSIGQVAGMEQPIPSIEPQSDSLSELREIDMTDGSSAVSVDTESLRSEERELDYAQTPIAPRGQFKGLVAVKRDTPIPELATENDDPTNA